MAILTGFAFIATRRAQLIPSPLQNGAELIVEQFLGLAQSVTGDRRRAIMFLPIVLTLFLFILVNNWIQLIPGFGAVGWQTNHDGFVPLLRGANSDLNVTLGLALVAVVLTQFFGIRERGLRGWVAHYFHNPLSGSIVLVVLGVAVGAFVGLLEVVSEFVKIVSLSFRLYGNIFAGENLLETIGHLSPYLVPVPFMLLEVIVGVVQAAVFSLLTLVFLSIITTPASTQHH
jgi:F-type H+-transporting ATPase subunit a